jgi:hypothetical protein
MNWDAIGAIGEIVAAAAVLITLIYLAVQIRQNTNQMERSDRAARGQSYQDLLTGLQSHLAPLALDESTSDLFHRGLKNFESLNDLEQFRFNWLMGGHIVTNENVFYQREEGMLSEERSEQLFQSLQWFFVNPGFRSWWKNYPKSTLHPEFVAMLDSYMTDIERAA